MFRKVTKTGPATLTIALPAKWVKEQKIAAGDFMELEEFETHLRLSKTSEKNPGIIKIPYNELLIENMLEKLFLESKDSIIIYSEKELPRLNKLVKKFPGLQIINEEKNKITIERTLKSSIKNPKALLRRAYLLIKESLKNNPPNPELEQLLFLLELHKRSKEVLLLKELSENLFFEKPVDDDAYALIKTIFRLIYKQKYSYNSQDANKLKNYFTNLNKVFDKKNSIELYQLYYVIKILNQLHKELIYQQSIEVLTTTAKQQNKPFRVGVCLKNQSNNFWAVDVKESIIETAKNSDVEFIFDAPLTNLDIDQQDNILNNFIQKNVDAIIYTPINPTKLSSRINEINKRAIPLLVLDTELEFNADFDFIGFDNYKGGYITGVYLNNYLKKSSKILLIEGHKKGNFTKRVLGFKDAMKKHSIKTYSGNFQESIAYELALKHLKNFDAVFATSDNMALGVVKAMKKLNLRVPICGFDKTEEGLQALNEGSLLTTVDTKPKTLGSLAVEHVINLLHKKPVAKRTEYDIELIKR